MNQHSQDMARYCVRSASTRLVEADTALQRLKPYLKRHRVATNRLEALLVQAGNTLAELQRLLDPGGPD